MCRICAAVVPFSFLSLPSFTSVLSLLSLLSLFRFLLFSLTTVCSFDSSRSCEYSERSFASLVLVFLLCSFFSLSFFLAFFLISYLLFLTLSLFMSCAVFLLLFLSLPLSLRACAVRLGYKAGDQPAWAASSVIVPVPETPCWLNRRDGRDAGQLSMGTNFSANHLSCTG